MKKLILLISVSLLVCLFIYVFYRTEKTVINQLFLSIFSIESYRGLKHAVSTFLPLNEYLIYSLPEGLWILSITITSKFFYLKLAGRKFNFVFAPLAFAIGLEICQLLHITNGTFDFIDIGFSVFFWLAAYIFVETNDREENIAKSIGMKTASCLASYSIVYLAHVIH